MSLCDDKRFILSHIRHSFITCDDTGVCETVMLNESTNRYTYKSLYDYPNNLFDYNSDDDDDEEDRDNDDELNNDKHNDQITLSNNDNQAVNSLKNECNQSSSELNDDEIELLKKTELDYQSELFDDDQSAHSVDIMYESYEMGIVRRRSNTAQKLDKLRRERKAKSQTKIIKWKSTATPVVWKNDDGNTICIKRIVTDPHQLTQQERDLLEYDENENVYYETDAYRQFLFPKKEYEPIDVPVDEVIKNLSSKPQKKSMLSQRIEQMPETPQNPFNKFTIFDGRLSDNTAQTKRVRIFFNIDNDSEKTSYDFSKKFSDINCGPNWIEVIVLANARVCDLIGLICWYYTHLQIGPPLKPDLSAYALKIAEENGDVDNDFPSLGFNDDIKRYGFLYLALVSVETEILVTVCIVSENVFSQFTIDSLNTPLSEIVEQTKKKRPHLFRDRTEDCSLQLSSKPGISLDLNTPISKYLDKSQLNAKQSIKFLLEFPEKKSDLKSEEFTLSVKEKSSSLPKGITGLRLNKSSSALYNLDKANTTAPKLKKNRDPNDFGSNLFDIMKAPLYQCFDVNVITKFSSLPIEMGISEAKLEITPKMGPRSPSLMLTEKLFARFNGIKAMNINIDDVVDCHLSPIQKQDPGKQVFKIIYWNGNDYKSLKLESETTTVDDILFKLQHLMKLRTSLRRNEFNTLISRKKSSLGKNYFKSKISSSLDSSNDEMLDNFENSIALIDKSYDEMINKNNNIIINSSNMNDTIKSKKFRKFRGSKNSDQ